LRYGGSQARYWLNLAKGKLGKNPSLEGEEDDSSTSQLPE
jgi:hypothetical protein